MKKILPILFALTVVLINTPCYASEISQDPKLNKEERYYLRKHARQIYNDPQVKKIADELVSYGKIDQRTLPPAELEVLIGKIKQQSVEIAMAVRRRMLGTQEEPMVDDQTVNDTVGYSELTKKHYVQEEPEIQDLPANTSIYDLLNTNQPSEKENTLPF